MTFPRAPLSFFLSSEGAVVYGSLKAVLVRELQMFGPKMQPAERPQTLCIKERSSIDTLCEKPAAYTHDW